MGSKNSKFSYYLGEEELSSAELERDLGVLIQSDLSFRAQARKVAQTCQSIISQINRSFTIKETDVMMRIYNTYVLPHLDFASTVWNPSTKRDSQLLERVQKKIHHANP